MTQAIYATPTYDVGDTAQFDLALFVPQQPPAPPIPIEATNVTLTVIAPDDTTDTIELSDLIHTPGQNSYAYRKVVDQRGIWQARWLATGEYAGKPYTQNEPSQIWVNRAGPRIISLAEAKQAIHYPQSRSNDDPKIRMLIDVAAEQIEFYCGPVLPGDPVMLSWPDGLSWATTVLLDPWPVARIVSLNGSPATAADIGLTEEGYVTLPAGTTEMTYVPGRDPIPQTLREAAQELVAHWWQGGSQFSMASPTQVLPSDDYDARSTLPGQAYGVPYRVLDKMRPHIRIRVA